MSKRFHKSVYWEDKVEKEVWRILKKRRLTPSRHFMEKWSKRKGVTVPTTQMLLDGELFEYTRNGQGQVEKFCIRCRNVDKHRDLVFVVSRYCEIITSWSMNKKDDRAQVDRSLYYKPPKDCTICPSKVGDDCLSFDCENFYNKE
jgi:hypothetical protein